MVNIVKYQNTEGDYLWRVRYRMPDGRQTDKRGFTRKIDAERWAAEHVTSAIADGTFVEQSRGNSTIGVLYEDWISKKRMSCKATTLHSIEATWRTHVAPQWANVRVSRVSRSALQTWVARLADGTAPTCDGTPRSATVVKRAVGIMSGILADAVADRRIPSNPAEQLALPRRQRRRHDYLTMSELWALADCSGWRRPIVLLLGLTGMRWGELAALRVGDVDVERRRIMVDKSASTIGADVVESDTKTYESRLVAYPDVLDDMMHDLIAGRDATEYLFSSPRRPGQPMKLNATGRRDAWLPTALRRAKIKSRITLHDLRHTAASLMVSSGANVKAVQRQLGHASAAMTLDVYADLFDDDLDAMASALSGLCREKCGQNVGK